MDLPSNYRLIRIAGDGNCFYRCISYDLHGTQEYYQDIKDDISTELKLDQEEYSPFTTVPFDEYLEHFEKDNVWVDNIGIAACAKSIMKNIFIYNQSRVLINKIYCGARSRIPKIIHLEYSGNHYNIFKEDKYYRELDPEYDFDAYFEQELKSNFHTNLKYDQHINFDSDSNLELEYTFDSGTGSLDINSSGSRDVSSSDSESEEEFKFDFHTGKLKRVRLKKIN